MSEQKIDLQKKLQMHCCSTAVLESALACTDRIPMRISLKRLFVNGEKQLLLEKSLENEINIKFDFPYGVCHIF